MSNSIFERITRAIDGHNLLLLKDETGLKIVEGYLLYESAGGDMLLHGRQISGAHRTKPPPKWVNLNLDDIIAVEISSECFGRPHSDYHPRSARFHRVVYEIDANGPRPHPETPCCSRALRPKRRSPPKAGLIARGHGIAKRRRA